MNSVKRIIISLLLLTFATVISAQPPPNGTRLTAQQVCGFIAKDGEVLATMYRDNQTPDDIKDLLEKRIEKDPWMAFTMPGIVKMLMILESIKHTEPDMLRESEFIQMFGVAMFNACMNEKANGWIGDAPGITINKVEKKRPGVRI